jgi:L-cysteine S-thiosulfotransferase
MIVPANAAKACFLALAVLFIVTAGQAGEIAPADRRSGYDFMTPETKAMQDDDTANPASLFVLQGQTLWSAKASAATRSCADCHGDAAASMTGVAARHPAFDPVRNRPVTLEQRINACRAEHQQAKPFEPESRELLAMSVFVARQSRGMPVETGADPRLAPFIAAGREIFTRRQGQLNLACTHCHDDHWGKRLAGAAIPQGHPTGYPIYRLEWQSLGSLQRRLRSCLVGMRSEAYAYNSPEFVALETFLMSRARGMPMETPGVRP